MRCTPRPGEELLCAPRQLKHYHAPDELSWDEWRGPDCEVERIDLENAANPEEADKLEKMTAGEKAVDGYYVVAGIARHEYKQGWKSLALWDGYRLSAIGYLIYIRITVITCGGNGPSRHVNSPTVTF